MNRHNPFLSKCLHLAILSLISAKIVPNSYTSSTKKSDETNLLGQVPQQPENKYKWQFSTLSSEQTSQVEKLVKQSLENIFKNGLGHDGGSSLKTERLGTGLSSLKSESLDTAGYDTAGLSSAGLSTAGFDTAGLGSAGLGAGGLGSAGLDSGLSTGLGSFGSFGSFGLKTSALQNSDLDLPGDQNVPSPYLSDPQVLKVPIPQPYPVHIPVKQPFAVPIFKLVAEEIERKVPIHVKKLIPVYKEKPVKVIVEKHHPFPVYKPYPVPVPVNTHVLIGENPKLHAPKWVNF